MGLCINPYGEGNSISAIAIPTDAVFFEMESGERLRYRRGLRDIVEPDYKDTRNEGN